MTKLYNQYEAEVTPQPNVKCLSKSYFGKCWHETMNGGVVDPETCTKYTCLVRKNSARGFAKCHDCETFAGRIAAALTRVTRLCHMRQLSAHHKEIKGDRVGLARIARLCKVDVRHVGFMVDAIDRQKFGLPTTERCSKSLEAVKKCRIIQKITGV